MYSTSKIDAAHQIMGTNFFGIEEAIKHFGVNATEQQCTYLAKIPFNEEVLRSCKETHVLVAVFPLSILDIRGHTRKQSKQNLFYKQEWYNKQVFAKDRGKVSWQLVRKDPITHSTSKRWEDQQTLLSKDEERPTARIVVYTMVSHFLTTGDRLFEKIYVRCVDQALGGRGIVVGLFDIRGFHINRWDRIARRGDDIALPAAWKQ